MRSALLVGTLVGAGMIGGGAWACSSSSSSGGGGGGGDAGDGSFTFQPQGCGYAVFAPATRALTDFATNDTAAADAASAAPVRVRLGLGGGTSLGKSGYADPSTTAAFTWETAGATRGAKVKLGADPSALTDAHAGFSFTLPPPAVGLGANEASSNMHEVHVCGLAPGKTYYYQVGGGVAGAEVWSATQSFTTVPTSGKVTIGLLGDSRDSVDTWQLAQLRMRDAGVNIQLISGDLVDIGTLEALYVRALDAAWKDPKDGSKFITLGQQMMVPIAGNHENEAARFYGNFAIPGDGPYAETFASFSVGGAHVVMLDDQAIALDTGGDPQAAAQLAWLDQDLATANGDRAAHPFVMVVSHRGLYSTSKHGTDPDVLQSRAKLAPLFDKYKVDLVVNGHDHEFERSKPLKPGADPGGAPIVQASAVDGTTYLISAGAGADPYDVGVTTVDFREKSTKFGNGTPFVGVYSIASIDGKTMTVTTYGMKLAGGGVAGDEVLDTLTLTH